jgi:hypothetical protein
MLQVQQDETHKVDYHLLQNKKEEPPSQTIYESNME